MDPRLFPDDLRRSVRLATSGMVVRLAMLFLPLLPTDTGYRSPIDLGTPVLEWGSWVVSGAGVILLTVLARSRLRQDPHGRYVGGGMLIALGTIFGVGTIATVMAEIEYLREVGDLLDMGWGPLWIYVTLGSASAVAFTRAGVLALRPEPVEVRPRRKRPVPLPPPPP